MASTVWLSPAYAVNGSYLSRVSVLLSVVLCNKKPWCPEDGGGWVLSTSPKCALCADNKGDLLSCIQCFCT